MCSIDVHLWKEYVLSSIKYSSLTTAEIWADLIFFRGGIIQLNSVKHKHLKKRNRSGQKGHEISLTCEMLRSGHGPFKKRTRTSSYIWFNPGPLCLSLFKWKSHFPKIFFTDVPFLIHVISFEVVITPLLTRLFLSHTDAQASSLLIFHTSLWLIFFSFLTWLGFEMTKIRMCWQHPLLSPSFPLSLFLSHTQLLSTLPFLLPCDSQLAHLWWVWWHPPLVSHLFPSQSFLLYSFIFPLALHLSLLPSLLSFLLCSSSLLAIAVGVLSRD